MKYILFFLIVLILFISCEKPYNKSITEKTDNVLVVEGMITNEKTNHLVKLSKLSNKLNNNETVSDAFVAVTTGDSIYYFKESSTNPGFYYSEKAFYGVINRYYYLYVEYQGKKYSATTFMQPVTDIPKLKYSLKENTNLYSIDFVAEPLVADNPAKYELHLDWSFVDGYQNKKNNKALLYYYSLTTIDVSQLFAPEQEIVYFPMGTQIIEKKYSLNQSHESFIRSLLAETKWSGGYFDEAHGNLQSNINNGGLGYFAASTVISDTIIIE